MSTLDGILQSICDEPADPTNWLVLADWLEENDEGLRAELLRLHRSLPSARGAGRRQVEEQICALLESGVRPCVPTRTNTVGMELVLIPPGQFRMGSPVRESERMEDEPLHTVRITRAFWMGVYPVTQAQYQAVTGQPNPSTFHRDHELCQGQDTDRFPVESVTWHQAVRFCRQLNRKERTAAQGLEYRLPTEAEWEYACRAWFSNQWPYHLGRRLTTKLANFNGETDRPYGRRDPELVVLGRPCVVGSYPPNAFGLFDMHGNVDEWVADWFDDNYYTLSPINDPPGPRGGDTRVIRGGSWSGYAEDCRAAVRIGHDPGDRDEQVGFRVVLASRGAGIPG